MVIIVKLNETTQNNVRRRKENNFIVFHVGKKPNYDFRIKFFVNK